MILKKIERFIEEPASADFNALASEAFAFQFERIEPYRSLCRRHGVEPQRILDWRDIPAVPTLAFKSLELASVRGGELFRSSGTTAGRRSVHRHGFPDLYRLTIDAAFPGALLRTPGRVPMLSLIADRQQAPDSSLSFMIEHVMTRWGAEDSIVAFGPRGVDTRRARSFLAAHQRDRQPVMILGTAFALAQLLEALERLELRFRLPAGSVVFETGGFKGRTRELARAELLARLRDRLDLPAETVVREYGMTELTSQLYTRVLEGGDPDLFVPPHWVRVRVLEPETLAEAAAGVTGLISILDLANLSSAVHLLTEDLGIAEGDGLRLVGRAAGAELRGCSLAIEELSGG